MLNRRTRRALRRTMKKILAIKIDRLAERAERQARLAEFTEDGRIAVVHGGIDCDGTMIDNQVAVMRAGMITIETFVNDLKAHAEGPCWVHWARPSQVAELRAVERDLALEAFEDGRHALRA